MISPFLKPEERTKTLCQLVPKIRNEVEKWRNSEYPGVSETTKTLINFWFKEEHRIRDKSFKYYFCQREAVETLIYLFEVKKIRRLRDLIVNYDSEKKLAYSPHEDLFPKYCFKMATGTGKTKVMTLAIVWSFFNRVLENNPDFTKNFLIIAPNIAVAERLKDDLEGGKIFRTDPLIPDEFQTYWDMEVLVEDEVTSKSAKGRIYLTNVQKLYERSTDTENKNPVEVIVGKKPRQKNAFEKIFEDITGNNDISVINDEAHHVWDPASKWNELIVKKLFKNFKDNKKNFGFQLDFSATPKKQTKGGLFEWIVTDYPLADAIKNRIVKHPIIAEVENAKETPSERADILYRDYIEAGVRRWRKYKKKMEGVKKNTIIFFMANKTKEAEDIRDFLETKSDLKGKILLIHTNLKGEISEKDWIKLKKESRRLDTNDDKYRAVVSVLMLREGWDVKNVNVIVGLRPYTSKANILPEQTLGRGLRLMFGPESELKESVDVFGSDAFTRFIEDELKKEGVKLERIKERNLSNVINIFVDAGKLKYDLEIPLISPKYTRINRSFRDIKVENLPAGPFELDLKSYSIKKRAVGREVLTYKQVWKDEWDQPIPENFEAIVGYYSKLILKTCKIPSKNYELIPKLKEYIIKRLFGRKLKEKEYNNKLFLRQFIEKNIASYLLTLFPRVINNLTIQPQDVKLGLALKKASQIQPFLTRKQTYSAKKCLLNLIPVDNDLEGRFCVFLDAAKDVKKYIKNDVNLNFYIEYVNKDKGISYYIPDFIVETKKGFFVVETKGAETTDVELKDKRAEEWCKDASELTNKKWKYIKVKQKIFDENENIKTFAKLVELIEAYELARSY